MRAATHAVVRSAVASSPALLGALFAACLTVAPSPNAALAAAAPPNAALAAAPLTPDRIERVVDGDTVVLSSLGKTRLIGMNTPETVAPAQRRGAPVECFGKEASARTRALLPVGGSVNVEVDKAPTDKFGRALAYLYLPDGTFVNGALVKEGYARAKAYPPNVRYKAQLAELEKQAKSERRGLWGTCVDATRPAAPGQPVPAGTGFGQGGASSRRATDAAGSAQAPQPLRPARTPAEQRARQREAEATTKPTAAAAASSTNPPLGKLANPGDTKNCADFSDYAAAKTWFDRYYPLYGDVAKLDGNGDGVPCESLRGAPRKSGAAGRGAT